MSKNNNIVWIRARLTYVSDKAIQFIPANTKEKYWLPKSQIVNLEDVLIEGEDFESYIDIEAKEWIVQKNNIPTVDETGEEHDEVEELDFNDNDEVSF